MSNDFITEENGSQEATVSSQIQLNSANFGIYFSEYFTSGRRLRLDDPRPYLVENQAALLERGLRLVRSEGVNYATQVSVDWQALNTFLTTLNGDEIASVYGLPEGEKATIARRIETDWQTSTLQLYDEGVQARNFFDLLAGSEPEAREEAVFEVIEKALGCSYSPMERNNITWDARSQARASLKHRVGPDKYIQTADAYVDALISLATRESDVELSDLERSDLMEAIKSAIGEEPWNLKFKEFSINDFVEGLVRDQKSLLMFLNSCTGKEPAYLALMVAQLQYAISRYDGRDLQARGFKSIVSKGALGEHLLLTILENKYSLGTLTNLWKVLGSLSGKNLRYPDTADRDELKRIRRTLIEALSAKLD